MQAMVMKMMLNGYGIIYVCCCDFIWVPVLVVCCFLVYSLPVMSLCVDKSWTYKRGKVEDTGGGHSDGTSYGGYSGDSSERYIAGGRTGGCVYRGDSLGSGSGYSDDGLYVGYSGKGDGYCGYRGYDKRVGGHKQVVQTVVYSNLVMQKEYL